ncbi:MAG: hypothetical protein E4H01_12160 [Lysobacterales bacterium]|nr:MAG: hypothetical protein E4H01_12160 [Xanthomonadales bacterium]
MWLLISVLVGVIVVALGFFFLGAGMTEFRGIRLSVFRFFSQNNGLFLAYLIVVALGSFFLGGSIGEWLK